MKSLFTLLLSGFLFFTANAQSFSSPESVEYDAANNRWFAGQNGSGVILVHSPGSNTLLPFATGCTSGPHGLEIMGSVLYACDGAYIRGFDLSNGSQVFSINTGATFLNGLTTDGSTYLFATDFTAKKIYRICPSTNSYNIMCSTVKTPNGIYYDGANNRCVFVTWGSNAPVQAMSLADSSVSTLTSSTMGNCDGITRDAAGYWYVTAWTGNQLWRFDPAFSSAPISVMSGLSSPADIDINSANDSIGIPNSGNANNVVYYTNITTGISLVNDNPSGEVYPNPANTNGFTIVIGREVNNGTAELYDLEGKLIRSQAFSGDRHFFAGESLPDGTYFVVIKEDDAVLFKGKVLLAPSY